MNVSLALLILITFMVLLLLLNAMGTITLN